MFCQKLIQHLRRTQLTNQQISVLYKCHLRNIHGHNCTYSFLKTLKTNGILKNQQRYARTTKKPVLKPLEVLQKYSSEPLLPENDLIFDPTADDIRRAQKLFLPSPDHKIEFLKSAVFTEHLPDYDLPEVAFIGRSNVGKSSLIDMLLSGVKGLEVRVSKTPGHTRLLNFFQLGKKMSVVDMPGYGHKMPDHYVESVETFLSSRQKLCRTFFLVDGELGLTNADFIGLNMMEEFRIPYVIVITKIDKVRPSIQIKSLMSVLQLRDDHPFCFPQPFLISSKTGDGVALLQAFVAYVTGNFKPTGTG